MGRRADGRIAGRGGLRRLAPGVANGVLPSPRRPKETLTFLRSGHGIEVLLTALEKPDRVWFGDNREPAATGSAHPPDRSRRQARHAPVRRRRDPPLGPAARGDVEHPLAGSARLTPAA